MKWISKIIQPSSTLLFLLSDMKFYQFNSAFVGNQWLDSVLIGIEGGTICSIESDHDWNDWGRGRNDIYIEHEGQTVVGEQIWGDALPGMINVHSHSFQRGLAGRSEYRTSHRDSFWTWRTTMYDFLANFKPEDIYRVTCQIYRELLRGGYTSVGEFHYVHCDSSGRSYERLNELSAVIVQAAVDTGINLCLIPTLYQHGGFGRPLEEKQKRFYLSEDQLFQLVADTIKQFGDQPNIQIGLALHSLRAVEVDTGKRVVQQFQQEYPGRPIHMHVAEQIPEVEECLAATGRRPIEYLCDHFEVDDSWCLIHCTQALPHELKLIADSKAVVGLCPTTEANLGDGVFPAEQFLELDGRFGIGTDSQVSTSPASELRMLEYSQRLTTHRRNVLATDDQSTGRRLVSASLRGGAQALGINAGSLEVGKRADLIVIDPSHPAIGGVDQDRLMDRWVFCDHGNPVMKTMVGGKFVE